MKEFIFLYPVQAYLDAVIGDIKNRPGFKNSLCERANEIIESRYRQNGYQVNWVMFCRREDRSKPALEQKAKELVFKPTDRLLISGVTFKELCVIQPPKYSDPSFILSQLQAPIQKVVVSGFHQWDCVDKFAETAYRRGIPTIVEEDLTEIYFHGSCKNLQLPLLTQNSIVNRDFGIVQNETDQFLLDYARSVRSTKPWFTQI